jgi:hypothetical protein
MDTIRIINKGLMFVLEVCMVASLGYWGFHNSTSTLAGYFLGLGSPLLAAALWGVFAAPKSNRRLKKLPRIAFSIAMFLTSAILLYQTGQASYAITFMIMAVICPGLVLLLGE